ncbi:EGF-like repeat and discoidin I-like domain-containing protein 3 [Acanthaster planci]|uniref:EGF-like repeat and discoidin I-like domain-containing protein 3 n=1 Tax=Acanthaster planci TaxID=133434 RepID=A0A8B7Y011_ACAPL|nr:EGF-like repeat and discoidin I-like domain-containing protein 3 [Acanthaster planci]
MMLPVLTARVGPFLLLFVGFSGCASRSLSPEFTDLSKIYGDVCGHALGSEISDENFRASGYLSGYEPRMARFNAGLGGWVAEVSDIDQWIQVRLPWTIYVTGVLTQGSADNEYYVTEYKVKYKPEGEHWSCILDMHSQPKIFDGNIDNSTPKINDFRPAVLADYIRILPVKWQGVIAMRLEIFGGGCEECWQK